MRGAIYRAPSSKKELVYLGEANLILKDFIAYPLKIAKTQ
jgi:hypothetical protein